MLSTVCDKKENYTIIGTGTLPFIMKILIQDLNVPVPLNNPVQVASAVSFYMNMFLDVPESRVDTVSSRCCSVRDSCSLLPEYVSRCSSV